MKRVSRRLGIPKGKYTKVALTKNSDKEKTNGEQLPKRLAKDIRTKDRCMVRRRTTLQMKSINLLAYGKWKLKISWSDKRLLRIAKYVFLDILRIKWKETVCHLVGEEEKLVIAFKEKATLLNILFNSYQFQQEIVKRWEWKNTLREVSLYFKWFLISKLRLILSYVPKELIDEPAELVVDEPAKLLCYVLINPRNAK